MYLDVKFSVSCMQIEKVSGPIILDWVIGQHTHILEWTGRALDLEVCFILNRWCQFILALCNLAPEHGYEFWKEE